MNRRNEFAEAISQGLAGWYQFQMSLGTGRLLNEDAAKLIVTQISTSRNVGGIEVSACPTNWGKTQKRVDIAICANSKTSSWKGAIEVKWLNDSSNPILMRYLILKDILRLASIQTSNLNAKLLVVGGVDKQFDRMFGETGKTWRSTQKSRDIFKALLKRDKDHNKGKATLRQLKENFDKIEAGLPNTEILHAGGGIKTELLARDSCKLHDEHGRVYVWQCNRRVGPKSKLPSISD
uniref:hypothetical protein n=1 Tax=Roseovarius indicus TaxID=540747 RepID=UPI003B51863D